MRCKATLRTICLAFTFAFFVAIAPALAGTADSIIANARLSKYAEPNFDRPGQDYKNFELDSNANTCEFACTKDTQCKAWTYVKPGVQGAKARCWLKTGVPPLRPNSCCTSGLKAGICESGSYWDDKARVCQPRVN